MIIYKVTNLVNNKIYIGKTVKSLATRKRCHISHMKMDKGKSAFHVAIRKYGEENFVWEIIDRVLFSESLVALERHYIKFFNCIAPYGYNLTEGGEGMVGYKLSEEAKEKLSVLWKGKKKSEETKRKIGLSKIGNKYWLGRRHSEKTIRKLSDAKMGNYYSLGKHLSAETRGKMSLAKKGRVGTRIGMKNTPEHNRKISEAHKLLGQRRRGEVVQ